MSGFRYYNPQLGRFLGRDPIAENGGLNLFAFCGNNGVNTWDYLGHQDGMWGDLNPALRSSTDPEVINRFRNFDALLDSNSHGSGGMNSAIPDVQTSFGDSGGFGSAFKGDPNIIGGTPDYQTERITGPDGKVYVVTNDPNFSSSGMTLVGGAHVSVGSGVADGNAIVTGDLANMSAALSGGSNFATAPNSSTPGASVANPNSGRSVVYGWNSATQSLDPDAPPVQMTPYSASASRFRSNDGFLGTSLTAGEFFSSAWNGAASSFSIVGSASLSAGPVGTNASVGHPFKNGLGGGSAQVGVTTSPKAGFKVGGNAYVGLRGNIYSSNSSQTYGVFTFGIGAPVYAQINIGFGQGGLTSVNTTLGLGGGFNVGLRTGGNQALLGVDVSPSGDVQRRTAPPPTWWNDPSG